MKNSVILGTTALIVILGGGVGSGYVYMQHQIQHQLDAGIQMLEKTFPSSKIAYEHSKTSIFSRSALLDKVKIKGQSGQLYTMDKLNIKSGSNKDLVSVSIDNFNTKIDSQDVMNTMVVHVDHIDLNDFKPNKDLIEIDSTGKIKTIYASKVEFNLLNLERVKITSPQDKDQLEIAQYQVKNYGLNRKSDQILKNLNFHDIKDSNITNNRKDGVKVEFLQMNGLSFANLFQDIENGKQIKFNNNEPTSLTIKNVCLDIGSVHYFLGNVQASANKENNKSLNKSNIFSNLQIQTDSDPRLYLLKQYGYDKLDLSGKINAQYQYDKQQWNFNPFQFTSKDIGTFNVEMQMKGPETIYNSDELALLRDYKIVSFKIRFHDGGLIQHLAETQSKVKNETVNQIKQKWIEELKQPSDDYPELLSQVGKAVIDVINHPDHDLILSISPNQPYSFLDLSSLNEKEIIDRLNIQVDSDSSHKLVQ